jgi:hypothetical protein
MTTPIFARDVTAARMLDMKPCEFRRLVDEGALPGPVKVAGIERWHVRELERILTGEAAKHGRLDI